jgi:Tol biopolymer transport system component
MLAFTARAGGQGTDQIYVMPAAGGKPRRITKRGASSWSGWSPDGKALIFSGQRKGRWGIFTIPVLGGRETALMSGAENAGYSPDGRYVYFHSLRAGGIQVWRTRSDGSGAEQVTSDRMSNLYPHVSPDGKWLAFLSKSGDSQAEVLVRVMSLADGEIRVMGNLGDCGGSMEAPCWAPDSKRLAFVSYQEF